MKALAYGFGALFVGGALTPACGGSSSDSSHGTAGNGTGNATAGTSGSGVAMGGSGVAMGGSGHATAGTGFGTSGNGAGGAAMNADTCPPESPTPATGDACTVPAMGGGIPAGCVYGTNTCYCAGAMAGGIGGTGAGGAAPAGSGSLYCVATPVACSATAATGDSCTASCLVPDNGGFCLCTMGAFSCQPPFMGFGGNFGTGGNFGNFGGNFGNLGGAGGTLSGGGGTVGTAGTGTAGTGTVGAGTAGTGTAGTTGSSGKSGSGG